MNRTILQMINHVIINKTKALLPQTYVTLANNKTKALLPQTYVTLADFGYYVKGLWFYCSQKL
jgi:hypothetical protein